MLPTRVVSYDHTGPAREVLALGELWLPGPQPGEVVVRLHASGVNPTDLKARGGVPGRGQDFPTIVPHHDGAGEIEAVGPGGDDGLVGRRVWVFGARAGRPFGTAAERVVLPAYNVAPLPDGVSFEEGACLGVPVMTAYNAVLGDGPVAGRTVLVTGGAGAVGHYAIQIARHAGAVVVATASTPEKRRGASEAGAHHVVDYREPDAAERILAVTGGRGADAVVDVDTTANAALLARVTAPFGRIASYGSGGLSADVPIRDLRQRCVSMRFLTIHRFGPDVLRPAAAAIGAMLEAGLLRHRIAARYTLEETALAHEALESGDIVGKVVVLVP